MARKAKKITKTTTSRKSKSAKMSEEKHVGYETVDWSSVSPDQYEINIRDTLRHYGYFYEIKDAYSWAAEWVKKNMTKQDLKYFKASSDSQFSMTAGGLCRINMNGATLTEKSEQLVRKYIDTAIARGKQKLNDKPSDVKVQLAKKSPADIVKERTSDFIAEVEEVIDMFGSKTWVDWENYSVYNELQNIDAPYNTAKAVVDYYAPLRDEIKELVEKKPDDLVEAYAWLGVRKRKQYLKIIQSIIDDAEKYMLSKKAVRKPRKKKATSATNQVSSVKYLKESNEYKITSIDPVNLVGAKEAYLFNIKYRQITHLVSSSNTGFEVKGTTIQHVDIEGSTRKTLRKPDEFLTTFNKTTKAKKRKMISELKTKPTEVNGRVNDQTLILKVY